MILHFRIVLVAGLEVHTTHGLWKILSYGMMVKLHVAISISLEMAVTRWKIGYWHHTETTEILIMNKNVTNLFILQPEQWLNEPFAF